MRVKDPSGRGRRTTIMRAIEVSHGTMGVIASVEATDLSPTRYISVRFRDGVQRGTWEESDSHERSLRRMEEWAAGEEARGARA